MKAVGGVDAKQTKMLTSYNTFKTELKYNISYHLETQ